MDIITLERLRAFAPSCPLARAEIIGGVLKDEGAAYGVSTLPRLHHFLAQVAHESGGFTKLEEDLSYSAPRLMAVWPKRFPTISIARGYERQPYALAEKVYGNRLDLGNSKPGEGWKYRGRGLIGITGKANYEEHEKASGLPLVENPALASEPDEATRIALAYWRSRGCNMLADADDLEGVTRRVNGGRNGLEDRARWLAKARKAFR